MFKDAYRVQFRFWLDIIRPEEDQLASYVNQLKEKRSFAQTIREALHLIQDLREGRVDVLLRLFPWIEDHFTKPISQPAPALPDPSLREQMARIEQIVSQLSAPSHKPMLLLPEPLPDDEPTIQMNRVSTGKEGWNALISMAALNNAFDELPPDLFAYGVEIGRIPSKTIQKKAESGPKKMDVPQFATPVFDDDDDDDLVLM